MYQCDGPQRQQGFIQPSQQEESDLRNGSSSHWQRGYDQLTPQASTSRNTETWGGGSSPTAVDFTPQFIGVSCVVVFVGTSVTHYGQRDIPMVARVTLINYDGATILDTYVRPTHNITDYRSASTGISRFHLQTAPPFARVQQAVAEAIQNNIIVGHRIWDFLSALGLSHPAIDTRDMALFRSPRKRLKSRFIIDLPTLVHLFLGREICQGFENSLEAGVSTMDLYRACQTQFEAVIQSGAWPCDLPPISFARYYL